MKEFSISIIICLLSQLSFGQCANGLVIFRETFGGSYSSVDIGPSLSLGSSSYSYNGINTIAVGEYGLRKKSGGMNAWSDGSDQTGQGGYMMLVHSKNTNKPFYETLVKGFCKAQSQSLCFSAASLSKKGLDRNAIIHVEIRSNASNNLLGTFIAPALKNTDSIVWSTFTFSYPLPKGENAVKLLFYSTSSSSIPDDFAIDDINLTNIGGALNNSTAYDNEYPFINGRYEYPVFACLNERVTFSFFATPTIGLEVQWERILPDYSYEPIAGANNIIYIIDSAKRGDSRFYRLRIADSGYINTVGCTSTTRPVGLRVDPEPIISSNTPICEGATLNMSIDEGSYVSWTGPNGFSSNLKKINIPNATYANGGQYIANVTFNAGCILQFEAEKNIIIKKNPIFISLPNDTTLCKGNKIKLDATNPLSALYVWSTGENTPTIQIANEGLYAVVVYVDDCIKEDTIRISVIEKPSITMRSDTVLCMGDTILLNPQINFANTYKWSNGAETPSLLITQKGFYSLQVTNECGSFTNSVKIGTVYCSEELLVPNAFTPNQDGLNDEFKPMQDGSIRNYQMIIYNRWGQQVFISRSLHKGWDGTFNKLQQQMGAYVWVIEYTSKTGKQHSIQGTVTLIR